MTNTTPPPKTHTRRASSSIALGATAVLATGLTGCVAYDTADVPQAENTAETRQYAQMCQDLNTGERVEDEHCDVGENGDAASHASPNYSLVWLPLWLNTSRNLPAVGNPINNDTYTIQRTAPQGGSSVITAPKTGGNIDSKGDVTPADSQNNKNNKNNNKPKSNIDSNGYEKNGFGSKGAVRASSGGHASSGG